MKKKIIICLFLLISLAMFAKGTCLPAGKAEPTEAVLDLNQVHLVNSQTEDGKVIFENPVNRDWETIKTEGFEGAWPNDWNCYSNSSVDCYWSDDSNRSSEGSWSGYCADGGYDAPTEQEYLTDMNAWMVYGPFSLADANDAELWYDVWYETESDYDYFKVMASTNGTNFYGWHYHGDSEGWDYDNEFDFTDVYTLGDITGENQVWVAFLFTSDGSVCYEGAYVDEVELIKNYEYPEYYGAPDIYSVYTTDSVDNNYNGYYESFYLEVDVDAVSSGRAIYRAEDCYITVTCTTTGEYLGEWGPLHFNDSSVSDNAVVGPFANLSNYNETLSFQVECENWLGYDSHTVSVDVESGNADEDENMISKTNQLIGNYPNPFNPQTFISYTLSENTQAMLKIYNTKGELVKTLVNETQDAGNHSVAWSGIDNAGNSVASGIYFYQLITPQYSETKRMIMMK